MAEWQAKLSVVEDKIKKGEEALARIQMELKLLAKEKERILQRLQHQETVPLLPAQAPQRPSTSAPSINSPPPPRQYFTNRAIVSNAQLNWKQKLVAVRSLVEAQTENKQFWVGIASQNTLFNGRWRDAKYANFLHFCIVFQTDCEEERVCMEADLIQHYNKRTFNPINGGGGPKPGQSPFYVYIVY